jgi:arylsulfatase
MDDMGYSDIGPFGSEIATPTLDALAARGVALTNYHTTPLCSPARAAIITGRNPHRAGFATVANFDPGFPGYTMEIADDVATLPEVLRGAGYATFAVGKWHLTLDARMNDAAPRGSWPVQRGFDRYYGILEGFTNLHHPHRLVRDNSPIEVDRYPDGYYFTDDITDQAIGMLKGLRANDADKPFFLYVAHGAVHGPLHAKPDDIDRHRGRYDNGWDALRAARFVRQLELGLFPEGTRLPERNSEPGQEVEPWSHLDAEEQVLFARYMEVYAGMVDNVDQNLGRLVGAIDALGELDDTIVVFTSDNGGTGEGGARGTRSYLKHFGAPNAPGASTDVPRDPDLIGGPQTLVHYPRGWGMASNTPFRLYKSNTHAGGVRVPFVLSWPNGLDARGLRQPYQYVTDLHPTLLDLAGVDRPSERHGAPVQPVDGHSFAPVLRSPDAPSTHAEQYSECFGNRSFYQDGWKLVTLHQPGVPYDDGEWELYDLRTDPTETRDLAADEPGKVKELADAWERAAWENQVFPLDNFGLLMLRRRPEEAELRAPVTFLAGTPSIERYRSAQLVSFRSFEIEIGLAHPSGGEGVLVAHGDQGGGYSLHVEDGRLFLSYNEYGDLATHDAGPLDAGDRTVVLTATAQPDPQWDLRVSVDGEDRGGLDGRQMLAGLAPLQGIDVGIDRRSPVSWPVYERHGPFPYTGDLHAVTYRPGDPGPYAPEVLVELLQAAAAAGE